jgi:hypothetical protein
MFSPVLVGCAIAADAHRRRRRIRKAGMPFTGACRRTNSQGRLRLRATASVEFGGFRAFRAVVKVASLRLRIGAGARGESGMRDSSGEAASLRHAANVDAGLRSAVPRST